MVRLNYTRSSPGASQDRVPAGSQNHITSTVLEHAAQITLQAGAAALFVYTEALAGQKWSPPQGLAERVFYVVKPSQQKKQDPAAGHQIVQVPEINLGRMDQVKIAVLAALARGLLKRGDTIACVTGAAQSGELDTIVVLQIDKEFDLFFLDNTSLHLPPDINPGVLDKVVSLATEMAAEGREGVSRGTILVVGDTDRVLSFSKQLIMNPFKGYGEDERNILDPSLDETVKELSAIDGAFVIRGDGVIERAGTYLQFASGLEVNLPPGLGARHQAAAGITAVTRAIAVTVSQSTGTVSIFRNGIMLMEIERPHTAGSARRV